VTTTSDATTSVLRYVDPIEGFRGYLALSGQGHTLAAGGLRVQSGLEETTIVRLAEAMALKERLLGLAVDGAKAGIAYDPSSPGRHEALRRFIVFLRPQLLGRLSLGPDMGTGWAEIEGLARDEGFESVKSAVGRAQGLDRVDFARRITLLDASVNGLALGQRRAGHALAHAALAAMDAAGLSRRAARVGIHGFGTLGRAAAKSLSEAGVIPEAVTHEHTCFRLDRQGDLTTAPLGDDLRLFDLPLDVLVLASCEDVLSVDRAARLEVAAVVVGANLGLSPSTEELLGRRGILVVPDFVGGCGGSASMDALFGPPDCPTPAGILKEVGSRMEALVATIFARTEGTSRQAAMALSEAVVPPGRPYGRRARSNGD